MRTRAAGCAGDALALRHARGAGVAQERLGHNRLREPAPLDTAKQRTGRCEGGSQVSQEQRH